MSEPPVLRAASAFGLSVACWGLGFVALRTLHRRDRTLRSPETASWQDDALAVVPLAWLFAARAVLRAVIEHEPPLLLHLAAAAAGAVALWVAARRLRRGRRVAPRA